MPRKILAEKDVVFILHAVFTVIDISDVHIMDLFSEFYVPVDCIDRAYCYSCFNSAHHKKYSKLFFGAMCLLLCLMHGLLIANTLSIGPTIMLGNASKQLKRS